jgi:hypothetical protein
VPDCPSVKMAVAPTKNKASYCNRVNGPLPIDLAVGADQILVAQQPYL